MKKIVVIGGGTGASVVLSGLKKYNVDLTAIISMADNGGSTGRLRDEFGFQPVGDLRQSLAALAREDSQDWIRKLLLYRFSQGEGLQGHNLGNLILTALQDMSNSTPKALEILESIFQLKGRVYPSTIKTVDLVIEYEDGTIVIGEDNLNPGKVGGKKIKNVKLSPACNAYNKALLSLKMADMIIIGPGDLYASIIPNFLVRGIKEVLQKSSSKIVYILNLMTRFTQTDGFKASDHINVVSHYSGIKPHIIILNNGPIPLKVKNKYSLEHEYPVVDDLDRGKYDIVEANLISEVMLKNRGDQLRRSLLRHDSNKLSKVLINLTN